MLYAALHIPPVELMFHPLQGRSSLNFLSSPRKPLDLEDFFSDTHAKSRQDLSDDTKLIRFYIKNDNSIVKQGVYICLKKSNKALKLGTGCLHPSEKIGKTLK
uniref:Uncharacterized protein n=1 Tax=Romanomermis culicivorax TaxID=13658 RepID=A0A915IV33_ROMCU